MKWLAAVCGAFSYMEHDGPGAYIIKGQSHRNSWARSFQSNHWNFAMRLVPRDLNSWSQAQVIGNGKWRAEFIHMGLNRNGSFDAVFQSTHCGSLRCDCASGLFNLTIFHLKIVVWTRQTKLWISGFFVFTKEKMDRRWIFTMIQRPIVGPRVAWKNNMIGGYETEG